MAVVLVLILEYLYSMKRWRVEVAYKVALCSGLFSQKPRFSFQVSDCCISKILQRYICYWKCDRLMNAKSALTALLLTAMLFSSPVVVADEREDIPTNAQNTGIHDSLVAALVHADLVTCLLYTSPSPRDRQKSRMPSSA